MPNDSIDTERLTLRRPTLADFADSTAMWSSPDVARYTTGRPSTREEVWARLLRYAGLWATLGLGYWVVRERATGRYLGEVGFGDFRRDITPPLDGIPEMGWVLDPRAHGRGYATEAVRAGLAWAHENLPRDADGSPGRIVAIIHPDNAPSIRVAEKCGFRRGGDAIYKDELTLVFER
jgi:RimJ/RimL family protein N-acetyltransferase